MRATTTQASSRLIPRCTADEFYPPDVLFVARVSWRWNRWSIPDASYRDFLPGVVLPIAGSTPVLCARASVSPRILESIGDLLPALAHDIRVYDNESTWRGQIDRALAEGRKLAVVHVHAPDELPEPAYAVARALLISLSDKSRLHEFVAPEHVARRYSAPVNEVEKRLLGDEPYAGIGLPAVLKAVDDESVAGGNGVRFCRTPDDVARAVTTFAGLRGVVVEEWLDVTRSECQHFGIRPDGSVTYLGTAAQVIVNGLFAGNTVGLDAPYEPSIEAAMRCARRAASLGYFGFAGIDVVTLPDGSVRVLDLNFRLNASTTAVVLTPADDRSRPPPGAVTTLIHEGPFESFIDAVKRAASDCALRITATFDPALSAAGGKFMLRGLVGGNDRQEVNERLAAVRALGFTTSFATV